MAEEFREKLSVQECSSKQDRSSRRSYEEMQLGTATGHFGPVQLPTDAASWRCTTSTGLGSDPDIKPRAHKS